MDWQQLAVVVTLIGIINALMIWAVQLLLRRQSREMSETLDGLHGRDQEHDIEIETIKQDLAQHKLDVARNYVTRDDHIIWLGRFEQKLDAIWQYLHEKFEHGSRRGG